MQGRKPEYIQNVSDLISNIDQDRSVGIWGREVGARFFLQLDRILTEVPEYVTTYISFKGINFDATFAKEGLVQFAKHMILAPALSFKYLVLCDLTEVSLENLDAAFKRQWFGLRPQTDCVIPVRNSDDVIEPVGPLSDYLKKFYKELCARPSGEFGSKDIKCDMGIPLTRSSSYLEKLASLRLLKRYERYKQGGLSYWYTRLAIQPTIESELERRHFAYSESDAVIIGGKYRSSYLK